MLTEEGWTDLCEALDAPDLLDDPRFATAARHDHDRELRAALAPCFARRASDDTLRALAKRNLPCEISSTTFPVELFDDPDIRRRGWVATGQVPGVGRLEQRGLLVDLARYPGHIAWPPCLAGEHTTEILAELGLDPHTITSLIDAGTVLAATP